MKIDQYCQRQRCKHVDRRIGAIFGMLSRRAGLSATAGLSCFQSCPIYNEDHVLHSLLPERNDHGYVRRRRRHERGLFLRPVMTNAIS